MNIVLLQKSEKPIYEQLFDQISAQIISGELGQGSSLPSIRTLARELSISIITVKKAYEMLEEQELIETARGVGSTVKAHHKKVMEEKKLDLAKEKLKKDLEFYKTLGLTKSEILKLFESE